MIFRDKRYIINVLLPLLVGMILYIFIREYRFTPFREQDFSRLYFIRKYLIQANIPFVVFIRNYLCDFLCAYAITYSACYSTIKKPIIILSGIAFSILFETFQALNLLRGTGDVWDVVVSAIGIAIAIFVIDRF